MIIPSIDIMNGKAVQLRQGIEKVLERKDVIKLAEEFRKYGEIAVIDIDSALGRGNNIDLIKKICKIAECRVGGGIRTIEKANELLSAGAKKVIIGTKASPEFLKQLPKERIIVAIDTKNKKIVDNGWTRKTNKTPQQMIKELDGFCSEFLFTNVDKEGLMKGCDFKIIKNLLKLTKKKLTVAGGITKINDILEIEKLNCNSQIGMALYTGRIKIQEAFTSVLDFKKNNGLIPTIVQDVSGRVLMMAYSSKESLKQTFKTNSAVYYSRTRKKIWKKGESSGNKQEFIKARYDCDRDTLLFTVKQKNFACHTGTYSCFTDKEFSLSDLYELIEDRINNPKKNSYTSKLSNNEKKIKEKIKEESSEVVNYKDRENLVWEIADLTYFIMILMAKHNISLNEIKNELSRRRK
jgi:phosphoribosylformimino-5-aminoimidazole carboxamide ribotide isomerase